MNRREKKKINGYFLAKIKGQEDDENDDSDDSEMEDSLDFREINGISDGGVQVKAKPLKRQTIDFKECPGGRVHSIVGHFPMVDPWWAAEISVSQHSMKRKVLHGVPSYSVRDDPELFSAIPLLLKECGVEESYVALFVQHLRELQEYENLNFETLPGLMNKVGKISQSHYEIMQTISSLIMQGPGKLVHSCLSNPDIFRFLPQLFPKSIHSLMMLDNNKLLSQLQGALDNEPWVFGYSNVMSYRYNLFGLEAPRQAYLDSGLISRLSEVQADALHIYTALKNLSRRYGHTYVRDTGLPSYAMLKDPQVKHWNEAFQFLEKNKVIVREVDNSEQLTKIYLWKNWKAEKSIAEHFKTILERHQSDPWTYEIDFESDQFCDFLSDSDQQRAVEMIANQPLVCLSGKGGCGKTHVVSRTFQHAQTLIQQDQREEAKRIQEEMFNESDVLDDYTLTQTVNDIEKSFLPEHSTNQYTSHIADDTWDDSQVYDCPKEAGGCERNTDLTTEVVLSQMNTIMEGSRFIDDYELEFYQEKSGASNDKPAEKNFPVVLLTAPTGKAANLLGKRAGLPSNTLHQVIYNYRQWKRQQGKPDSPDLKWKYSCVQALVVDECSLVSVQTFSTMLSMLMQEATVRKLVLLGDINQLPSIEPGNFLADTYQSLDRIGCSTLLTTNHRTGAQLIVHNATLISQRQMPLVDSSRHFHVYSITEPLPGVQANTEQDDITCDQDQIVRKMLADETPLDNPKESQFVAFRRRDCEAINEICCKHYCKHTTRNDKNRRWFCTGDKICCSKNATVRDELSGKDIRLCNGEIFFITEDIEIKESNGKKKRFLKLKDEDSEVKIEFIVLRKSCKIRHAWARTIHTYQGSESGTVVYVVGSPNNQTWQHVYTAVTRGKKQVYILTRQSYLHTAVLNTPRRRNTSLKDRLTKMITKLPTDVFPRKLNSTFMSPNKSILNSPRYKGYKSLAFKSAASSCTNGRDPHFVPASSLLSSNLAKPSEDSVSELQPAASGGKGKLFCNQNDSQAFSDWGEELELSTLDNLMELYNESGDEETMEGVRKAECNGEDVGENSMEYETKRRGFKDKVEEKLQAVQLSKECTAGSQEFHLSGRKSESNKNIVKLPHSCDASRKTEEGVHGMDSNEGQAEFDLPLKSYLDSDQPEEEDPLFDVGGTDGKGDIKQRQNPHRHHSTHCVRRLDRSFDDTADDVNISHSSLFDASPSPTTLTRKSSAVSQTHTSYTCFKPFSRDQVQSELKPWYKPNLASSEASPDQRQGQFNQNVHRSPSLFDSSLSDESLCLVELTCDDTNKIKGKTTPKRSRGRDIEDLKATPKKVILQEGSNVATVEVSPLRHMIQNTRIYSPESNK